MTLKVQISLICFLALALFVQNLNNFDRMKFGIKEALSGSRYECDKYQSQPYKVDVRRNPLSNMPFTERRPKKKKCLQWNHNGKGAVKSKCVKYGYVNYNKTEHSRRFKTVTRRRTVCVEGHLVKKGL